MEINMKLPIALQLYSVRDEMDKDFAEGLKKVREIGYEYVELAGLRDHSPEDVKKMLDDAGLKAISAHVGINSLQKPEIIDGYKTIGCRYLAVPNLPGDARPGAEYFDRSMNQIRTAGELCREKGITLLYHNHEFEFIKMPDGSLALDYMYANIPADILQTELDLCWVKVAGYEPVEFLKKYADRAPIVHFKDFVGELTPTTDTLAYRPLGEGVQDFPAIAQAVYETIAKYVVVEQDRSYDIPQIEAAKRSFEYLKTI